MAGDWIKVEHVTPDKPEIDEMAAILGMKPEEVLGRLVRVWIWADQQSIDGNAVRVTSVTLSKRSGCDDFAAAMRKVGWLGGEDMALTFPNFERHNGESAKKRALTARRVARHRNANVTIQSLPEKRREEVTTGTLSTSSTSTPTNPASSQETPDRAKRGRRAAKVPLPGGFAISERVRAWAAKKGFGRLDEHLEAFKAKVGKLGLTYVDWDAAFEEAVREDWAGLRGKNGNHAAGAPASAWRAGAEPKEVLIAAADLVGIAPWNTAEGETFGQFRTRIVEAGGELLLRGKG